MNNCGIFLLIIFVTLCIVVVRSQHKPHLKCMFSSNSKLSLDLEFSALIVSHTKSVYFNSQQVMPKFEILHSCRKAHISSRQSCEIVA